MREAANDRKKEGSTVCEGVCVCIEGVVWERKGE